jgi:hypothetical protein
MFYSQCRTLKKKLEDKLSKMLLDRTTKHELHKIMDHLNTHEKEKFNDLWLQELMSKGAKLREIEEK